MESFKLKTLITSIQSIELAFYHIHLAAFVFTPLVLYQLPGFTPSMLLRNDSDRDIEGKLVDVDHVAAGHPFFIDDDYGALLPYYLPWHDAIADPISEHCENLPVATLSLANHTNDTAPTKLFKHSTPGAYRKFQRKMTMPYTSTLEVNRTKWLDFDLDMGRVLSYLVLMYFVENHAYLKRGLSRQEAIVWNCGLSLVDLGMVPFRTAYLMISTVHLHPSVRKSTVVSVSASVPLSPITANNGFKSNAAPDTYCGQVLEYLSMGSSIIDKVLDEIRGRVVLPALTMATTTTKFAHVSSNAGLVEDIALYEKDLSAEEHQGECRAPILTMPRLLIHFRIESQQLELIEDYGFYIVRAATRNRTQNEVRVQFRDGIWNWQVLLGKQDSSLLISRPPVPHFYSLDAANHARTCSSSTTVEQGQVINVAEGEGPHVGGTFIVIISNPELDKDIWQNRIRCAVYLHLSLLLEHAFLQGCPVPLPFPSSMQMLSPITPPRMTSSSMEMESGSSRCNTFITNIVRLWFSSFGSIVHSPSLPYQETEDWNLELTPTRSSEDAPLPRLKRLLSHRHFHSLAVAEEQPNNHIWHRNRKPLTIQSTMPQYPLSTSPSIGVWVWMRGLTYHQDEKDQLSEVIRDMHVKEGDNTYPIAKKWVHASVSIVAEVGAKTIHPSLEDVMVVDQEEEEEDQDNEDVELLLYLSCAACRMKTDMKSLMNAGLANIVL
ncbi:hypothetical protein ARMSODRAFT_980468 [Armillaria solidipes]|uniref:Uncharacterized protein n=1 Tax=Armillaria solidipes TaxID=1076256 RepID=A0A2H3AZA7_9AGAR|nr:hypothetical protein ARMSODRAFT_980468 [Armillaria solidipes]